MYKAQNPYSGYTRPEDSAEADRLYDRYAPDRDRAKTRYDDAKAYRDQTVSDGRSNKTSTLCTPSPIVAGSP